MLKRDTEWLVPNSTFPDWNTERAEQMLLQQHPHPFSPERILQSLVLLREEGQCLRLLRVGRRDSHGKVPCFLYTVLPRTVMMFGHFCHLSNGCFLWAIDILP